jgi:hypothetical protein
MIVVSAEQRKGAESRKGGKSASFPRKVEEVATLVVRVVGK